MLRAISWSGFLLLAFLGAGGEFAWGFQDEAETVKRFLDAIKSRGEPTTRREVEEARIALPQGVEDVSEIWLEGIRPTLVFQEHDPDFGLTPYLDFLTLKEIPAPFQEWPDLIETERFLTRYEASIRNFRDAGRRGGWGRINDAQVWNDGRRTSNFEMGILNASRMLELDAAVQSRNRNAKECARSLTANLVLPRAIQNVPGLYSTRLLTYMIDEMSVEALARVLCVTEFTDADLEAFRAILSDRDVMRGLPRAYQEQRVVAFESLMNPWRPEYAPPAPKTSSQEWELFFTESEKIIDIARKPFPECLIAAEKKFLTFEARLDDAESLPESTTRVLNFLRNFSRPFWLEIYAGSDVYLRAAQLGIAVECYRRKQGALPKTLSDLAPEFLATVPTDPFSGESLRYKVDETGFTIYSVGRNRVDDNGRLDGKTGDQGLFFPTTTRKTK